MGFAFNPFTGNFDAKGSGGGGSSYIDGEVQNFSALPETLGTPAVDSAYLVREAEGTWLLNRKPAGIYIRTANTGTRASDWTYAGEFPDVFSDANFVLYDSGDSTRNLQFQLSGITTGTTRTLTVPDASGTIALTSQLATGSTDNAILRADGTGGAQMQASDLVIDDYTASTQGNVTLGPRLVSFSATIDASDDFVTATGHTFVNGDQVRFTSLAGGAGLTANARYFVVLSETNRFKVSTTLGGGAVNITTDYSAATVQRIAAVVITPQNAAAFILGPKPDGTTVGGNARGAAAVDLQMDRDGGSAADVASSTYCVIGGGARNRATALASVVSGGRINAATNNHSTVIGGRENTASGDSSSVCGGETNQATALYSCTIGGNRAIADRRAIAAHAGGMFSASGDAQRFRAVLRCKTTTNNAVEMALDGSATYLAIPSGKVIFCNIKVVGVKSDGSVVATYERQYAAKNVAGTSSEVFAPVTIGTDNASSTSLEVATVDAGDYIRIRPTGIASETWRWVASVDAVEVAYGS